MLAALALVALMVPSWNGADASNGSICQTGVANVSNCVSGGGD